MKYSSKILEKAVEAFSSLPGIGKKNALRMALYLASKGEEKTSDFADADTQQFSGVYHVLEGVISPIDGIGPEDIRLDELIQRIRENEVEEVIMAISSTIEGETTTYYLSKRLKEEEDVTISVIARGVSFGGDLEYADEVTLGRSIVARQPYHKENN